VAGPPLTDALAVLLCLWFAHAAWPRPGAQDDAAPDADDAPVPPVPGDRRG
jgi:hypothetical protein